MYSKTILYRRGLLPAFLIVPALLLPTGCKKSGGYPISAGATFRFTGNTQLKPLRAFIYTGEVLDSTVLAGLAVENSAWTSDATLDTWRPAFDSIYFASSDSGFISGYSESFSFRLRRSGKDLTFTATSTFPQDIDTSIITAVDSDVVFYPYLLADRTYDSGPFFRYQFTYQAFATQTSANQLSLPGMVRDVLTPLVGYGSGIFNNKFNPGFDYRLLPPGDTLIFREFVMLMQAK
jgi:hypothetical protein